MRKTPLILSAFIFSSFFIPASYAMRCCCSNEEEAALTKQARAQERVKTLAALEAMINAERKKEERKINKQAQGNNGYQSLEEEPDEQEISLGNIVLKLPKTLKATGNNDGSKSIAYEEISIQIFKNYGEAIKHNKDINAMQEQKVELRNHRSLTYRMEELLYKEIGKKSNGTNKETYDVFIALIKNAVEEIPDGDLCFIRLVHDKRNRTFSAFLKIKDGALLIKALNVDPPNKKS